ncbi:hypothetical protein CALCODRAFT_557412 [Calocera cornea HHB12733]|uniref:Uncharacterized protein n=1 Tax=Calocera cornea HHB12733 TaxID=1353952 RepID=A0A165DVM1_9BASI|nr:hypothetical protein CALCODRAFT_557412 [Calocera cornea HHB12733]
MITPEQDPLLEKYGTLLLLKQTMENVKKNHILRTHVDKGKLRDTIDRLELQVQECLKRKRAELSSKNTHAPKVPRHNQNYKPESSIKDESELSDGELSDTYSDLPTKAQLTKDDEYSLAHWLASGRSLRKWGDYKQIDWAGFAKLNEKRDRRAWRNWYISHPPRKARIDTLVQQYKAEMREQDQELEEDGREVDEIQMNDDYDSLE